MQLSQGYSQLELKKQYIKLTKMYHPDLNQQNNNKFWEILEAYQYLNGLKSSENT